MEAPIETKAADSDVKLVAYFKRLAMIQLLLSVASFFVAYIDPLSVPVETRETFYASGAGAVLPMPPAVTYLLGAVWVAVSYGVYSFAAQARLAMVMIMCFYGVLYLLGGIFVGGPISGAFSYILTLAQGALMALCFHPQLKYRFV